MYSLIIVICFCIGGFIALLLSDSEPILVKFEDGHFGVRKKSNYTYYYLAEQGSVFNSWFENPQACLMDEKTARERLEYYYEMKKFMDKREKAQKDKGKKVK